MTDKEELMEFAGRQLVARGTSGAAELSAEHRVQEQPIRGDLTISGQAMQVRGTSAAAQLTDSGEHTLTGGPTQAS